MPTLRLISRIAPVSHTKQKEANEVVITNNTLSPQIVQSPISPSSFTQRKLWYTVVPFENLSHNLWVKAKP